MLVPMAKIMKKIENERRTVKERQGNRIKNLR